MGKRWIGGMTVVALLTAAVLAGCERGTEPAAQSGNNASEKGNAGKFDPPITITTAKALSGSDKLKPGDTLDDNPMSRWARDRLGIIQTYKWTVTDQSDALATKVRLALTGGEELPDVLFLSNHDLPELLPELVGSGEIMDMGQAFENYASPRVKEAFAGNPDVWRTVAMDGKVWGLPQISDGKVGDPVLWIRQDWLERLGLKTPKTLDELEQVMDAFVNRDPDGNGAKDTVALAYSGKNTLNAYMSNASFLFGAFGDQPYQWNRMKNGQLAYGTVQPETKTALARLRDWYSKGYIDKNFGTHDEVKATELFTSGKAGLISGPGWMGGWPLSDTLGKVPGAVIKPLPFPAGPDGKIGRIGSRLSYGAYVFRKGFEHMDAIFQYWDIIYGTLIEDPESEFRYGFADGYDFIMKNGEPVYDFEGITTGVTNYLLVAPGSTPPGIVKGDSLERRVYQGQIRTPYEKKLSATSSRGYLEGLIVSEEQLRYAQRDEFVGPHTETMKLAWPLLQKQEKEALLKIVYGKEPLDTFDSFVEQWRRLGGDAVTKEVNEWYRSSGKR
ncbi:extracellular solute-binding protein [Paenibacillus chartarius]|uniref:Extracellular solute-binding protein n=1 Tax=Paenibacillus chartarius TaxID=747481 RepID=A0ABV6DUU8_9BACL